MSICGDATLLRYWTWAQELRCRRQKTRRHIWATTAHITCRSVVRYCLSKYDFPGGGGGKCCACIHDAKLCNGGDVVSCRCLSPFCFRPRCNLASKSRRRRELKRDLRQRYIKAQIPLRRLPRNFAVRGSFWEVGVMEFGLKGTSRVSGA